MPSAGAGFSGSAKEHGLGGSDSSSDRSRGIALESQVGRPGNGVLKSKAEMHVQTGDCTASEQACRLNPPATDLPRNDGKLGDPTVPSWLCIMALLFCVCALVVAAVAVRGGPAVVDEISHLWKDPIELDIMEMHDKMPTTDCFTHSEEKVLILEHALDHIIPAKSPGLKSLTEILRKRIREGNTSAIATYRLLTKEIPSCYNNT